MPCDTLSSPLIVHICVSMVSAFVLTPRCHQQTDGDGTFGPALPRRNTGSSASNFSLSSGLNSMSSVCLRSSADSTRCSLFYRLTCFCYELCGS